MKILMINKFFYIKGGSETYYFALKEILQKNGHTVIDFSMKDDKNFSSEYSDYFVDNVNYNNPKNFFQSVKYALKIIYSFEARHKLKKLIEATQPDIAHLHIFQHQLSLSIIDILNSHNIPIVYTAHDLKMLCPNYQMFNNHKICEKCKKHKYYQCTLSKCVKKSYIKSAIISIESYVNYLKKSYDSIKYIITPSKFYNNKFKEFGINPERLVYIPNFLENNQQIEKQYSFNGNYVYFGRLSEEKGLYILIDAFKNFNKKLIVIGTGPMEEELRKYVIKEKINNVIFKGFKQKNELQRIVKKAKCVVAPSSWYENSPYSIIESLQLGKPIIGSDLGGISEMIINNKNGFLFKNNDINSLIDCLNKMENLNEVYYQKFSDYSYKMYRKKFTADRHYKAIMSVYKKTLNKGK